MQPQSESNPEPLTPLSEGVSLSHAPAADTDATLAPSDVPGSQASASIRETIPGYEIVGELGRGGMSVVYQARQVKLDRIVALKKILAGSHASGADLQRFRTEAEAIARLQHPNIVQIFEIGEHEGQPFFSLEFCAGGSLDRKLAGTPLPPLQAAQLVETLARAMHAAHQAHVIHRDLKPANVLLLPDGTLKITDFGLARKLDDVSQTQSGAIMGTPSYMAPEQAGGKSKELGPATDIYALGAMLYELLTGRPPFKAATILDTLHQVLADEPIPPSRLQSQTPRDLETICLKCLGKVPGNRYPTAEELAEDLRRFQAKEPISARPVSRFERSWRWCERNPTLAGALIAMLLVFVMGAIVSSVLAAQAIQARGQAKEAATKAGIERDEAVKARNELKTANTNLTQSRNALQEKNDLMLRSLARSLLVPLAGSPLLLSDPEIEALGEIASTPEEGLRLRIVEEMLHGPVPTGQLRHRAALILQAIVGLDDARRMRVEQLLWEGLLEKGASPEQKRDVAVMLAQLGGHDPDLAGKLVLLLTKAISQETDRGILADLEEGLSAVAVRMEPREAVATLSQTMSKSTYGDALRPLAQSLSAVAARMGPKEAANAALILSQTMSTATNQGAVPLLAEGLAAVAGRMEPREAAAVCGQAAAILSQNMSTMKERYTLQTQADGLAAVTARLGPKEAAEAASILSQTMNTTTNQVAVPLLAEGLTAVAGRMEPRKAAVTLTRTMSTTTHPDALRPLVQGLTGVSVRMESREAAEAAVILSRIMSQTSPEALEPLAEGLAAVAARMEPREAVAVLSRTLSKTTHWVALRSLAKGLTTAAVRMEPKEATTALCQAISKMTDHDALKSLAEGLMVVAARMEPRQVAEAADILFQTLSTTTDPATLRLLAEGLTAVAARMEPREAAVVSSRAAATLSQIMITSKTTDSDGLWHLAQGLVALVTHMEPREAVATLYQTLTKMKNREAPWALVPVLSAIAARMEPREAVAVFTQAIKEDAHPYSLGNLAEGLATMAGRLEPREAAAACGRAATVLSQAMSQTTIPYFLGSLGEGLAAVAGRLEPREAAVVCGRAAAAISRAMSQTTDSGALESLAEGLAAVAVRMEPREAAAALSQLLSKPTDRYAREVLCQGLSTAAARMAPREAAEAAVNLSQTMSQTTDLNSLQSLARGLAAVAGRMEPREAVAILSQTMTRTTNPYVLRSLAEGLAGVAARMEPQQAAADCGRAVAHLFLIMSKTMTTSKDPVQELLKDLEAANDQAGSAIESIARNAGMAVKRKPRDAAAAFSPYVRKTTIEDAISLRESLAIVLARQTPAASRQCCLMVASTMVCSSNPGSWLSASALLQRGLEPLPPPLPPSTLVELLKHPFCVGPSRRLILEQLSRHYGRPFIDQWDFVRFTQERK